MGCAASVSPLSASLAPVRSTRTEVLLVVHPWQAVTARSANTREAIPMIQSARRPSKSNVRSCTSLSIRGFSSHLHLQRHPISTGSGCQTSTRLMLEAGHSADPTPRTSQASETFRLQRRRVQQVFVTSATETPKHYTLTMQPTLPSYWGLVRGAILTQERLVWLLLIIVPRCDGNVGDGSVGRARMCVCTVWRLTWHQIPGAHASRINLRHRCAKKATCNLRGCLLKGALKNTSAPG